MAIPSLLAVTLAPVVSLPRDFSTNLLMMFRWIHLLAAFTWVGLDVYKRQVIVSKVEFPLTEAQ